MRSLQLASVGVREATDFTGFDADTLAPMRRVGNLYAVAKVTPIAHFCRPRLKFLTWLTVFFEAVFIFF